MIKKILITFCLLVPTVYLCMVLLNNQHHIGSKKDFVKKEYVVEGMTCKGCEYKLKEALNSEFVSVELVDYDSKRIVLHLDPLKMNLTLINKQLSNDNYVLKLPSKDTLKVLDYQIKYH
tara:strand:- start:159 stop:515 length:357 start_codon:yes stop_codon:yes gene_type:complete